jgi:chromate transporter
MKELLRLFLIFLKIGATAFGGNVALVAAVRKELCEKRKMLSDAQLLDMMTMGNLLPGPFATNVITASGFAISGMLGAMVSLFAVLLPAFVLVCLFSAFYLKYGQTEWIVRIFSGLLPGVAAIIAYTAWSLAKTNIKKPFQIIVLILAGAAILIFNGFLTTFLVIVMAGLLGYIIAKRNPEKNEKPEITPPLKRSHAPIITTILIATALIGLYFFIPTNTLQTQLRLITLSFSSMSVTLFGGGYVFIPAIESVVVGTHQWVTSREFADAIAISQVTPGPISISAAFVGWKVAGIKGATLATLGIFIPPALLTILAQQFLMKVKSRPGVTAVFAGVRPAVIGMIAASIWVIAKSAPPDWQSFVIFAVVLSLALWKKLDSALLILIAGVMGWFLHLI